MLCFEACKKKKKKKFHLCINLMYYFMVRNCIRKCKNNFSALKANPPAGLYEGFIIYVSSAEQWSPLVALHPNICIAVDPKGGLDTKVNT